MTSGDGWIECAAGHRHWGRFGAAGLLLHDEHRVILQHRAPWTHEGDSWGLPGGARDSHEDPIAAAVREAGEEAGLVREDIDPVALYVDDHGGWSYSTVVARPTRSLHPIAANAESVSVQWQPVAQVEQLRLHRGFAAAWQHLRSLPPTLYLVLDPAISVDPRLTRLVAAGISVQRLPVHHRMAGVHRLFPHPVEVTTDGQAAAVVELSELGPVLVVSDEADVSLLVDVRD